MESSVNFDRICRLCGTESLDLINIFEVASNGRNLAAIIKTYLRVSVNIKDVFPKQVCGPCLAKLDEVVDFMNLSQATQTRLQSQLKEDRTKTQYDQPFELVPEVKVEQDDLDEEFVDDLSDVDYGRQGRRRTKRSVVGRGGAGRGSSGRRIPRTQKNLDVVLSDDGTKELHNGPVAVYVKGEDEVGGEKGSGAMSSIECEVLVEESPAPDQEQKGTPIKNTVRCGICEASFDHQDSLITHSLETHQVKQPRFMCPQCPRTFPKITSMTNHQRRKHQETLQGCPKCRKLYPAHYLWTRHMLVHTNTRPFGCDECDKKFKSKPELFNHKKTHRPSEERYTHCCEVCGKRFTQKANLESHLRLHTGSRPFSCEFCGKCFSQRGNMEEHRRIHTGEKPFVCDVCGVSYSRQGQLAMHKRTHTGDKPHKCQYCEKEFVRREVLRKHEHMHTDTRPYKCSYCEKCFRDQGKRKVHERLHTGERPYECQFCGRGFCESGNLRKHLRVHQHKSNVSSTGPAISRERDYMAPEVVTTPSTTTAPEPSSFTASHSALPFPGVSVTRHTVNTDDPVAMVSGATNLSPAAHLISGAALAPQTQPSLGVPLNGGTSHPLVTLRPLQDPCATPNLTPVESDGREVYRVSTATSFHSVGWTLYQT